MAVLGKIRSKGALLVGAIGLALFAFIAEEAFRSCETTRNDQRQQIAEILGEKLSYQDFQKMVDEYTDVVKMMQGKDNLTEEELNNVRDQAWQSYISAKLIEDEAKKLGLTVTDDEMREVLNEGTNPVLRQVPFFMNQQTGRFDANALKQFLSEYKKATQNGQVPEQYQRIYNYWQFMEKNIREQLLAQKYQVLVGSSFLSNPVEAKQMAVEENEESEVKLVAYAYDDVKDVTVSDDDIKAAYNTYKPLFRQYEESRDIKFVSVKINATAADKAALLKTTQGYVDQLATAEDPSEAVRKSNSQVAYLGVPVLKDAFPRDIAELLDSVSVGSTTKVTENKGDNTYNAVRLISRAELPDSIEFQVIQVGGATPSEAHGRADSIYNALKADATQWEALAKKYGQTGEKTWMTTQQYMYAPSLDKDTRNYISVLNTAAVGELRNIETTSGNLLVKVTDRKAFKTKYIAAVVKTFINFSKDTRTATYNKFSEFVSKSQTLESLESEAKKYGYEVREFPGLYSGQHTIPGIRATHEALKWAFEAKEGEVSPLYECGDNDNLLVVVLTKINRQGYNDLDNEQVKAFCKEEATKTKKAEKLIASLANVKDIKGAMAVKGAKSCEIPPVTFASPAYVQVTATAEPALSGAIAGTKAGQFCSHPVKGERGVYVFQVTKKNNRNAKPDLKAIQERAAQMNYQMAGNVLQTLYLKANIVDNRYIFF